MPFGTLFSKPQLVTIGEGDVVSVRLDQKVPISKSPGCVGDGRENSDYIKTVRLKSEPLSKFWGRDIVLEACVLLPWGFESHPVITHTNAL